MDILDLKKIIQGQKNISSAERRIYINLYNAIKKYGNSVSSSSATYTQFELAYNVIRTKISLSHNFLSNGSDLYFDNLKNINLKIKKIKDMNKENKIPSQYVDLENSKEINFNKNYNDSKERKNIISEMEYEKICYEYFIMLDDCMKNYDLENETLKKRIIHLITILEILLKLPITFPTEIINCALDLSNLEEKKDEKGCGARVRRIDK